MGKLRKESGITLIALVVTIIVLLILAGVSIGMLTGENGILNRSKEAREKTETATRNERVDLDKMSELIEETVSGEQTVEQVTDEHPGQLEEDGNEKVINSIEDLVFFAYDVTSGNNYEGQTVKLGLSLDFNSSKSYVEPYRTDYGEYGYKGELKTLLTSGEGFKTIGSLDDTSKNLKGTFDGKGNTIYNLYFYVNNRNTDVNNEKRGLFANNFGTIQNLNLLNVNLYLNANNGSLGGISGQNSQSGIIENCTVSGNIKNESDNGHLGGITSYCSGKVAKCCNLANIFAKFRSEKELGSYLSVGGICSRCGQTATIENCYNVGNIDGENETGYIYLGGIVGNFGTKANSEYSLNFCYNIGNVSTNQGDGKARIGKLIGYLNNENKICNSYYLKDESDIHAFGNIEEQGLIGLDERYMRSTEFVTLLNNGQEKMWKQDSQNKNKGYPILNWQ